MRYYEDIYKNDKIKKLDQEQLQFHLEQIEMERKTHCINKNTKIKTKQLEIAEKSY